MQPILQEIYDGILNGEWKAVEAKVQDALDHKISPKEILDESMVTAMRQVGYLYEAGEYYVPDMLIAARAMQAGMAILKPQLKSAHVAAAGKVAVGTVKGDLHDIGKNLVAMMLEGANFEIVDMGTDVSPQKVVSIADQVDVIALSALLTTTMTNMKVTIDALKEAGKRDQVKVIVGGAPVTEDYAREIGADGYAQDASRAVTLTQALLGK